MAYEFAIYEKRDRIAHITINRPEVMNALHPDASRELSTIWDDFAADDDLWVAILTGAGSRGFSAGNDLKATASRNAGSTVGNTSRGPIPGGFGGLTERFDLYKPVIGAVNGWAMGGGCELALACDILVASENARFGLPEPRVGLAALAGGIHRLPRQIPLKIAMGMLLTAKPIDAAEAHRLGLVNEVVPLDQLLATAERWAAEILECAPLSVRGSKEAAMVGLDVPLRAAIRSTYPGILKHLASDDAVEGPRAFSDKRQPNWTGG
ncbi:MAG: enoyl-CoA hydratase-related protein [Chloroflexi bacterium]|nr:enoyl-CoA hydratase-related protein [Chloroflexota bacterium]MDA1147355.1 enoyl-CoA hydratase-related protein [Chloroflexota bacterium]